MMCFPYWSRDHNVGGNPVAIMRASLAHGSWLMAPQQNLITRKEKHATENHFRSRDARYCHSVRTAGLPISICGKKLNLLIFSLARQHSNVFHWMLRSAWLGLTFSHKSGHMAFEEGASRKERMSSRSTDWVIAIERSVQAVRRNVAVHIGLSRTLQAYRHKR